jgi:hypothetical protein
VNCYYNQYEKCSKARLTVKDEACVHCALEDTSSALWFQLFLPTIEFPEVR